MKVLLLGATGLIGRHCLSDLLATSQISEVIAPTRRSLQMKDQALHNVLVDFDRLDEYPELFEVDAILCCLGTTIKQAGSRERFKLVDYQYCMDAAELGRAHSAKSFSLVSAIGASARSLVFYSRVKGQLEDHLKELEYPSLSIFRPSLLLGDRQEARLGEAAASLVAPLFNPLLVGSLSAYKAIEANVVAKAMVNDCLASATIEPGSKPKVKVYSHDKIVKLASD
ncbi:NAD(P)H-binding protein [Ketobacter alkanivorans]|uniref:Nucleoside-diphosphate sugar epimerase n=1 Tax=Ketobacter alkanivorans TaxID=1917421 RepID=A0A2K9LQY2_9GAMM|nr:NAD(P)H-binding protein [Ketobacter alkanivorans]AUM14738.1 nucleoside-diphosphate sugar epimerase [Ketobacter alkanivorans]